MKKQRKSKIGLVVGLFPEQYNISDPRLNKPVCHQKIKNGNLTGSMLLQDIDIVNIENKVITYFSPNNIGLLLSINLNFSQKAEKIYQENLLPKDTNLSFQFVNNNKKEFLNSVSKIVCDFIETIQISIVFGYTALEAFANLSIPDDYTYKIDNKSRGIQELYDKIAIERWLSLKIKFQHILSKVYKTKKLIPKSGGDIFLI